MSEQTTKEKQKQSLPRRIARIIGIVLIVALLILFVLGFISNRVQGKPLFVFGHAWIWVETGSMEPTIPARSYILIKQPGDAAHLEKGTVITFMCTDTTSEVYGSYITHRIDEVVEDGYKTKGDNVISVRDKWTVHPEDILSVYVGNLGLMTFIGRLLMSPMGLAVIIMIFVGLCAFVYIPEIVKAVKDDPEEKKSEGLSKEEMDALVAAEIEKLKQNGGVPPKPETPSDATDVSSASGEEAIPENNGKEEAAKEPETPGDDNGPNEQTGRR